MYQHSITTGNPESMRATSYDHLMDNAGSTFTAGDGIALGGAAALVVGAVLIARHAPPRKRTGLGDRGGPRRTTASRTRRTWPAVAP